MKRHHGFSLIELLFTVGLLAIVLRIIIPLMNWGVTTTRAAQRQSAIGLRFDGATAQLRTDIWQATSVKVDSSQSLSMHEPDGISIQWRIGPGDQLSRNNYKWNAVGITDKTAFKADAKAVRLVIPPQADGTVRSITFIGQTLLLIRGSP